MSQKLTDKTLAATATEGELREFIESFADDPEGFVDSCFPWGKKDLPPNKDGYAGPRVWQRDLLRSLGERLRAKEINHYEAIQEAVASGHGIGKSAFVAWVILWALATMAGTRGIVTASTERQLKTKTWPELKRWYKLFIARHWFVCGKTSIHSADPEQEENWRFDAIPWSEHNPEAFQGLHNQGRRIVLVFDEASGIADVIWETAEGALTDEETEIIWLVFGNPTRSVGRFKKCFGQFRHRWSRGEPHRINSMQVEGTNKQKLKNWIDDYGWDSDFVRVRVRGVFPRASDLQFIASDLVEKAQKRKPGNYGLEDALIMALDVARGGDDNTVFRFRRGMDAKSIPAVKLLGAECRDSMRVVDVAVELMNLHKPDAVFIDGTGIGGPIANRIRQLGWRCFEINFGSKSPSRKYLNRRAFMWAKMRDWLRDGGAIDADEVLAEDLTSVEYTHNNRDQLFLEKKEHMKQRGLASPDDGDALALTFAFPVHAPRGVGRSLGVTRKMPYDPHRHGRQESYAKRRERQDYNPIGDDQNRAA